MDKQLFRKSIENYNKNSGNLILISVFFCLISCGCLALDYLISGLSIFGIFFLVIPCFFGALVQSYALRYNPELTIGKYFKYSYSYYRPQFYGSFHLLSSFLKAFLIEFIFTIVTLLILHPIYSNMFGASFNEAFDSLMNYIEVSMNDLDYLNEILEMNGGVISNYINVAYTISGSVGILAFVYFVSYNAVEALLRSVIRPNLTILGPRTISASIKHSKKNILKDFIAVNWPLYLLAAFGLAGGVLLSLFVLDSFEYALTIGTAGMFILMIPYFPIYLCNVHCIYERYQLKVFQELQNSMKAMLLRFLNDPNLTEEQKAEANRIMSEMMQEKPDEDNKKDPESGS